MVLLLDQVLLQYLRIGNGDQFRSHDVVEDLVAFRFKVNDRVQFVVHDYRREFDHQVQVVRLLLLPLIDEFDLAERESIQPVDLLNLSVAVLLSQFRQSLHLVLLQVLSLAWRCRGHATVACLAGPNAQVVHSLAENSILAEHGNGRSSDHHLTTRTRAVVQGEGELCGSRQVRVDDRQGHPFVPAPAFRESLEGCRDGQANQFSLVVHFHLDFQGRTLLRVESGEAEQRVF